VAVDENCWTRRGLLGDFFYDDVFFPLAVYFRCVPTSGVSTSMLPVFSITVESA